MERFRDTTLANVVQVATLPVVVAIAALSSAGGLWASGQYALANGLFAVGSLSGAVASLWIVWAAWSWWRASGPRFPYRLRLADIRLEDERSDSTEPEGSVELTVLPITPDGFVHVKVINSGAPDEFVAKVTDFRGIDFHEPQTEYTAKWRESKSETKTIYEADLIDLAQVLPPADEWGDPKEGDASSAAVALLAGTKRREHVGFSRGAFRLFSVSVPNGWLVHGSTVGLGLDSLFREHTTPPEERKLFVFDEEIRVKLRVVGTRRQSVEGWIRLGFTRPQPNYTSGGWFHNSPIAEMTEE